MCAAAVCVSEPVGFFGNVLGFVVVVYCHCVVSFCCGVCGGVVVAAWWGL